MAVPYYIPLLHVTLPPFSAIQTSSTDGDTASSASSERVTQLETELAAALQANTAVAAEKTQLEEKVKAMSVEMTSLQIQHKVMVGKGKRKKSGMCGKEILHGRVLKWYREMSKQFDILRLWIIKFY